MNAQAHNKQVDNLDEKLKEILTNVQEVYSDDERNIKGAINKIKQVFTDFGYLKASETKGGYMMFEVGVPYMTGQEWYDRFEKEMLDVMSPGADPPLNIMNAAKKASGL